MGAPWGGSEILWTKTASLALEDKHDVLASVFDWPQQPEAIRDLQKRGAKMVYRRRFFPALPARIRKRLLNLLLPSGKKSTYHDYLLRFGPDRILFSLGCGLEIAQDEGDLMRFIRQTKVPYYIFFHSLPSDSELSDSVKRNALESFRKARRVFFTSRFQIESLERQLGSSFPNFAVLNHPLTSRFGEALPFPVEPTAQIAMVGSLIMRWKGQDRAIRILSENKWRLRDWKLNIYGEGRDRHLLLDLIRRNGMEGRIVLRGQVEDHHAIWAMNHLLLIASLRDSGPIALFEAMNAGRPVVSTYIGAAPEYVKSNITGVLASGGTDEDLEKALEQAWQHKKRWVEWGSNASGYLKQHYDFNAAHTLLNILSDNS